MSTGDPNPRAAGSSEALVLILGTADWDAPIATNQHYVTRELAQAHSCLFIQGTGTRRLRLTRQDAARVWKRLRSSAVPSHRRLVPSAVEVLSPKLWPAHGRVSDLLNRPLLMRQVQTWLRHQGPRLLWTFTPYTYGLEHHATATLYHLVDLLHQNPGVDAGRLQGAERRLAASADVAIGTSPPVVAHLVDQGFDRVLEKLNVADVAVFEAAAAGCSRDEQQMPTVIFTGALSPHKVDFGLLKELAADLRGLARVRLIGPEVQGVGVEPVLKELQAEGVRIDPPLPLDALAREVASADVGVIPYQDNPLTRGISPLKMYEFLAAGLPVVTTPIPSIRPATDCIWVEGTRSSFIARVREVLVSNGDARAKRQSLARRNDWRGRGDELRKLAADLLRPHER
jgi:glycosyltransferase involved in cell wall biosynthesis